VTRGQLPQRAGSLGLTAVGLMIPWRGMQPSTARDSGQVDPQRSTTDILPPQLAALGLHPVARRLLLINRPRRDGTLSRHWYTAATGGSRTRDLAIAKSSLVPLGHRVCPWYARLLPSFRWYSLTDPAQQPWAGFEPTTSLSQVRHRTTRIVSTEHKIITGARSGRY